MLNFPTLPFSLTLFSHSLSTVELSLCCSLGLKFLGCAEAAGFFKHGSASPVPSLHLPQFENLAVHSTAWLEVRETIEVEVSKQTPLYGLYFRMRKERHAWHFRRVFWEES